MIYQKDENWKKYISFIELLNTMGLNIVFIGNNFYLFTEFVPTDDAITEIRVIGKNITTEIENAVMTRNMDTLGQRELITRLENLNSYSREFHRDTLYIKYLA